LGKVQKNCKSIKNTHFFQTFCFFQNDLLILHCNDILNIIDKRNKRNVFNSLEFFIVLLKIIYLYLFIMKIKNYVLLALSLGFIGLNSCNKKSINQLYFAQKEEIKVLKNLSIQEELLKEMLLDSISLENEELFGEYPLLTFASDGEITGIELWQRSYEYQLSDRIGELKNLTHLVNIGNFMQYIPTSVYDLNHLKTLNFNNNAISVLSDAVVELKQLKILELSFNLLKTLPLSLGELTQLEVLKLGGMDSLYPVLSVADVQKILSIFGHLSNLKTLELPLHLSHLEDELSSLMPNCIISFE